jgi:small subunit ribosomal protein S15
LALDCAVQNKQLNKLLIWARQKKPPARHRSVSLVFASPTVLIQKQYSRKPLWHLDPGPAPTAVWGKLTRVVFLHNHQEITMPLTTAHTAEVVKTHARGAADTGSPEVQVALLTTRINELTPHFKLHAKDHHGRRGLLKMVNARKRLLSYLKDRDASRYTALIAKLGLRK